MVQGTKEITVENRKTGNSTVTTATQEIPYRSHPCSKIPASLCH